MLSVVCFKWNYTAGHKIPSQKMTNYTSDYVIRMRNMVRRHYRKPHRFICVTDDPTGLEDVETVPMWREYLELGGCYHRLQIFSDKVRTLFGPRFITIDLDSVIVGDMTPIFERTEDFVMNSYCCPRIKDQHYNGSLILMDAGARSEVWNSFHNLDTTKNLYTIKSSSNRTVGTDQAWIRLQLGKGEARFTEKDGVYDYKHSQALKNRRLPENARIIFFSGPRNPQTEIGRTEWIRQNWR